MEWLFWQGWCWDHCRCGLVGGPSGGRPVGIVSLVWPRLSSFAAAGWHIPDRKLLVTVYPCCWMQCCFSLSGSSRGPVTVKWLARQGLSLIGSDSFCTWLLCTEVLLKGKWEVWLCHNMMVRVLPAMVLGRSELPQRGTLCILPCLGV